MKPLLLMKIKLLESILMPCRKGGKSYSFDLLVYFKMWVNGRMKNDKSEFNFAKSVYRGFRQLKTNAMKCLERRPAF